MTLNISKTFITFGGPTENYHNSAKRICEESLKLDFFDYILCFTEKDLQYDTFFWKKHGEFLKNNSCGYGYWLWKPYLIKKCLDTLNENDILIYADAGCQINIDGKNRLNEYIDLLQKNENNYGILSFQCIFNHCQIVFYESQYTKRSILDFFNYDLKKAINTIHNQSTVIILMKNKHSVEIIDKWYELCENYELINGEKKEEYETFIDNRHDQSIFSMLINIFGSIKLVDETWFFQKWEELGKNYPFWAKRLR